MSAINLAAFIAALPKIKSEVDAFFAAIDPLVPDAAKATEADLKAKLEAALAPLDLDSLTSSAGSVLAVVKAGRGVVGGGADQSGA